MNVSLTAALEELVQKKVATGLYNDASEVVREALRLLEMRDRLEAEKLERLKTEAALGFEALERGEFSLKSPDQIADESMERFKSSAAL